MENIYTVEHNQHLAYGAKASNSTVISLNRSLVRIWFSVYWSSALGPRGHKAYTKVGSPLIHMGGFVITNKNKHVPETLRWMDYFYGEEGADVLYGYRGII